VALPGIRCEGRIDFVSAGRQDGSYGQKVALFDWHHFYGELGGGAFLDRMRELCVTPSSIDVEHRTSNRSARYDYVLIDSRTGLSDTAGICTAQLPDKLICLYTYNVQSIEGASQVARSAVQARLELDQLHRDVALPNGLNESRSALKVFPVGSRADESDAIRL